MLQFWLVRYGLYFSFAGVMIGHYNLDRFIVTVANSISKYADGDGTCRLVDIRDRGESD
jgi:hypothetical protein